MKKYINKTHLWEAIDKGQKDVLETHLKEGGDPNEIIFNGDSMLAVAIERQQEWAVLLLIKHGVDIEGQDKDGQTPLIKSVIMGGVEITERLLDAGADINTTDDRNRSAIYFAMKEGHLKEVKMLITRGADVNSVAATGMTPWLLAKTHAGFQLMIDENINPLWTDNKGRNALHYASRKGLENIQETLIQKCQMDVDCVDHNGETPLMLGAAIGWKDACLKLLTLGASANKVNKLGNKASDMVNRDDVWGKDGDGKELEQLLFWAQREELEKNLDAGTLKIEPTAGKLKL